MFHNYSYYDEYITFYKRTILNDLLNDMTNNKITYDEYYKSDIRNFYFQLLKSFNTFFK